MSAAVVMLIGIDELTFLFCLITYFMYQGLTGGCETLLVDPQIDRNALEQTMTTIIFLKYSHCFLLCDS